MYQLLVLGLSYDPRGNKRDQGEGKRDKKLYEAIISLG